MNLICFDLNMACDDSLWSLIPRLPPDFGFCFFCFWGVYRGCETILLHHCAWRACFFFFCCCQQDFFHSYIIHNSVLHFHTVLLQWKSSAPPPTLTYRHKNRFEFWTSFLYHSKAPDSHKPRMQNLTKAKCDSMLITAGCVFELGSCSTESLISFDSELNNSDVGFSAWFEQDLYSFLDLFIVGKKNSTCVQVRSLSI